MAQMHIVGKTHTTVATSDGVLQCTYHSTVVAKKDSIGIITLNSGGWKTNTTKVRMNQFSNQYCGGLFQVFQKNGEWFVKVGNEVKKFFDGIEF